VNYKQIAEQVYLATDAGKGHAGNWVTPRRTFNLLPELTPSWVKNVRLQNQNLTSLRRPSFGDSEALDETGIYDPKACVPHY